jgi:hypothetical protein
LIGTLLPPPLLLDDHLLSLLLLEEEGSSSTMTLIVSLGKLNKRKAPLLTMAVYLLENVCPLSLLRRS